MRLASAMVDRFWASVRRDDADGCWEWVGPRSIRGQGVWHGRPVHVVAYELMHGVLTDDTVLVRRCSTSACVRPSHFLAKSKFSDERVCVRCGRRRRRKDFNPTRAVPAGAFAWCIDCKSEFQREYVRLRSAADKQGYAAQAKAYRTAARYGLTGDDYEAILALQGGGCAGCGKPPSPNRRLDVDHRHQLQEARRKPWERMLMVRGLLCHRCNRVVGMSGDNPDVLRRLAEYLEQPPAYKVVLGIWLTINDTDEND